MKPKQMFGLLMVLGALAVHAGIIEIPDNIVPNPTPNPPTRLYAIVVEETGKPSVEHRIVLASPVVRNLFEDPEDFRVIDPDTDVTADLQKFKDKAKENPADPVLFLIGPDETIYYEGELPDTVDGFESLYREIMS